MSDYKDPFCILPLRDIVVFPNMIVPLFVGRNKSIKALEYAEKNDKENNGLLQNPRLLGLCFRIVWGYMEMFLQTVFFLIFTFQHDK